MHPIFLGIGSLEIRWYGAMIALACVAGYWLGGREAERKGIGKEKFHAEKSCTSQFFGDFTGHVLCFP